MNLLLKLKNGNKEELTMAEAKELYEELHQLFGKPEPTKPMLDWPHIKNPWEIIGGPLPQTWYGPVKGAFTRSNSNGMVESYGPIDSEIQWPQK